MSNAPTDELTDTTLPTAATWKASMHAWHVQIGPHSEMKSLLTVAVFWRFGTSTHRRCRPCTRQSQRIWRPRSSIEQDREPSGRPRCRTGLCQGPPESTHAQRTRCRWLNTVARDKGAFFPIGIFATSQRKSPKTPTNLLGPPDQLQVGSHLMTFFLVIWNGPNDEPKND